MTRRQLIVRTVAVAGICWLTTGLGIELGRTIDAQLLAPRHRQNPMLWRFGTPAPERLRRFLEAARPFLPAAGSRVAFSTPKEPRGAAMRFFWAVYFLPTYEVIPARSPAAADAAVWLSVDELLQRPDLEPLFEVRRNGVYRLRPNAELEP